MPSLLSLPAFRIQGLVLKRSTTTPPATATRPPGVKLSLVTPPAAATRPTVLTRVQHHRDCNTAIGVNALYNTTGSSNTAIGVAAGDLLTGNGNVCIGRGVHGVAGENNTTRIRNISDTVQPVVGIDPDYVTVDSNGRLGRANVSSRRYKHDIKPMDKASEALYALKPVSFRYNRQYDATQTLAFGLIAEEVAEVYPDLVGRNAEGQPESVRYEQINAMLLNEFLKEHRKVQELEANAVRQQKQIEALTAGLQKVNAQLELSGPAPQTVVGNQ